MVQIIFTEDKEIVIEHFCPTTLHVRVEGPVTLEKQKTGTEEEELSNKSTRYSCFVKTK